MVMLSIWLLLLIIPLSVCDAPNIPSNDPAIPEDEYDAIKLLWEEKHREIVYHEETKRSRLKPSYNEDTSPHQLDVIDVMKLTSSHHQTSHDQDNERSRRQTNSTRNATSDHDGSGSGDMRCDEPEEPVNGSIITNATTAVYLCEEGFVLLGNQYRSCNFTTWTWNGTDPTCEVDCSYTPSFNCSDENNTMKYYYNSTTQMCQQIITCDGPGNLFNFLEECNQECPGRCVQDVPYNGSCDSRRLIYYYHVFEDRCYPFNDSCPAVRGNENSFVNLQECLGTCRRSCDGPDTEGVTRLHRGVWVTSNCSTCQCTNGLVNCQPMNLTECPILYCGEDEPITLVEGCCPVCPSEIKCDDPPSPANGDIITNSTTTVYKCEEGFVLLGNQYRSCDFTTLTWNGINPTCEVDCSYTPSVNCSDENNTMKYYYNSTTQMCQQIITCDGPGNLFNFLEECNQECPGRCVQEVPYSGSCDSRNEIYYYHVFEDRCYPFQDGCPAVRGNENSFLNLQECLGTCRRSCDGPDTEGVTRLHREVWVTSNCSTCQCTNGLVNCQPMDLTECPILYCGEDDPITLVEGCCPVCPNESCNATEQTGDIRLHNETWTTSDCEQCQCTNGNVTCSPPNTTSPDCDPVSNCSGEIVISNATMCCPVCIDTACKKNGMTYSDGESFMEGLCTTCQCTSGEINCTNEMCSECPNGTSSFNITGECCPGCRPALKPCGLMSQEPEILSLFGGECSSLAPVTLNQCPEQCVENNVINCCIPLTAARQTDFECQFQPGFTIALKYLDTTDCNCSPCG